MKARDPLTGHDHDCPCEQCIDAWLGYAVATDPEPFFAEQLQREPDDRAATDWQSFGTRSWAGVVAAMLAWIVMVFGIIFLGAMFGLLQP
jgi:hypothetical protein